RLCGRRDQRPGRLHLDAVAAFVAAWPEPPPAATTAGGVRAVRPVPRGVTAPAEQHPELAVLVTAGLATEHDWADEYGIDIEDLGRRAQPLLRPHRDRAATGRAPARRRHLDRAAAAVLTPESSSPHGHP